MLWCFPSSESEGQSVGSGEKAGRKFSTAGVLENFRPALSPDPTALTAPGSPRMGVFWSGQYRFQRDLNGNSRSLFLIVSLISVFITSVNFSNNAVSV